jgi:hypothetical protein
MTRVHHLASSVGGCLIILVISQFLGDLRDRNSQLYCIKPEAVMMAWARIYAGLTQHIVIQPICNMANTINELVAIAFLAKVR